MIFPGRPGTDYPRGFAAKERAFLEAHGFDPDKSFTEIFTAYQAMSHEQQSAIQAAWSDLLAEFTDARRSDPS